MITITSELHLRIALQARPRSRQKAEFTGLQEDVPNWGIISPTGIHVEPNRQQEAKPQLSSTKEMPGYVPHGILSAHLIDIKIKSSTDVAG